MNRLIAIVALLLPASAWGQVRTTLPSRLQPPLGLQVKPLGPLGTTTSLYIEDSVTEPSPYNGSFFKAVAQGIGNNPQGRPVFEVGRWGGISIWDYLVIGADLNNYVATPGNGSMLGIGSDLGPLGLNQTLWSGVYANDFMEMAIHDGGTYDTSTKRFRFTNAGALVFGSKVATAPALKPNGTTLEVRLGDDSALTGLKVNQIISQSGYLQGGPEYVTLGSQNNNYLTATDSSPTRLIGTMADGSGSVGVRVDTYSAFVTMGARPFVVATGAVDVLSIGKDGDLQTTAMSFLDDSATTGSRTVNLPNGRNAFAAGTASITITNLLVTSTSRVFVVLQTNDATAILKSVVPGAGNFVVTLNGNATGITKFGWMVVN